MKIEGILWPPWTALLTVGSLDKTTPEPFKDFDKSLAPLR